MLKMAKIFFAKQWIARLKSFRQEIWLASSGFPFQKAADRARELGVRERIHQDRDIVEVPVDPVEFAERTGCREESHRGVLGTKPEKQVQSRPAQNVRSDEQQLRFVLGADCTPGILSPGGFDDTITCLAENAADDPSVCRIFAYDQNRRGASILQLFVSTMQTDHGFEQRIRRRRRPLRFIAIRVQGGGGQVSGSHHKMLSEP